MTEPASHSSWIGRDLPPIRRDGRDYFIVGHRGALYLIHNHCPHRGGALKFGYVDAQDRIVCPLHHNAIPIDSLIARPTTLRLNACPVAAEDLR
jgi:nitrite reductase/ring-hydroxylating ferredoxin subunit